VIFDAKIGNFYLQGNLTNLELNLNQFMSIIEKRGKKHMQLVIVVALIGFFADLAIQSGF
jgi:hypothetical protein